MSYTKITGSADGVIGFDFSQLLYRIFHLKFVVCDVITNNSDCCNLYTIS